MLYYNVLEAYTRLCFKLMTRNLLRHDNFSSWSASPFLRQKLECLTLVYPVTGDCCSDINKICMPLVHRAHQNILLKLSRPYILMSATIRKTFGRTKGWFSFLGVEFSLRLPPFTSRARPGEMQMSNPAPLLSLEGLVCLPERLNGFTTAATICRRL